MRKVEVLETEFGVPGGIGEFAKCASCGSLVSPPYWADGAVCPVCAQPASDGTTTPIPPDRLIDRIAEMCLSVFRGETAPSGRDLAGIILGEIPHTEV